MLLLDDDLLKFPRTFHMPWSPGATNDDKILKSMDHFEGQEVVATEKNDGENTTMTRIKMHARSLDSKGHWSRERVKQLYNESIKWKLQEPQFAEIHRVCGENMQAMHSIHYTEMEAWFYCFAIWNRRNHCYSWDDMVLLCDELEIKPVILLARGIYSNGNIIESSGKIIPIKSLFTGKSHLGGEQEGYVLRLAREFHYDEYGTTVAKYVRTGHVQTDGHWMFTSDTENKLKGK